MIITPFGGTAFWLCTIAFIAIYSLLQLCRTPTWPKQAFMIVVNTAIVVFAIGSPQLLLLPFLILTLYVFFLGRFLLNNGKKNLRKVTGASITLIVFFLCYFKYSVIQAYFNDTVARIFPFMQTLASPSAPHIFFIGVSYFSFKFIHFLVECHNGKVKDLSFLTFLNYILFFPSFFSGPINRYNTFAESLATQSKLTDNFLCGSKRLINGLFKKIVLGDFLFPYSIAALDLSTATRLDIIIGVYAYMLYIYFNFSGYTDMAIGCGRMVGIDLPENFNYPFFKRNLQQFWANWHISLTAWLTDYIYWPLARKFRDMQALRKKPVTLSNICIIITFLVCGLWHGDGLNFFIWGAYHGIGLAILNVYTYVVKKHGSMRTKKFIHKSPMAYGISNFITFQYVAFGFLLFACDIGRLESIFTIIAKN
jgi:alginate O-acetyltransferase complex protein AlgI